MRRLPAIVAALVCCLVMLAVVPPAGAEEALWQAGTARAKITPEQSMWLAGYGGRNRPSEGTLCDLWVKVLAIQTPDGRRGVVVTCDLLGIPRAMYEHLVAELGQSAGLRPEEIMLSASHTHTGPVLHSALYDIYPLDDQQRDRIEAYSAALEKTIVNTVEKALGRMTPAALAAAEGTCAVAVNRRNNKEKEVPELRDRGVALAGPVDHGVPVLAVRSPDGKLRAVVFGYACHATTLASYEWSGDYPGFAQLAIEEKHPGVQAMFFAGCGADQNPLPRRTVELCRQYGETLAASVETVLGGSMPPIRPTLQTAGQRIDLPFDGNPTKEELQKAAAHGGYTGRWAARLLEEMKAGRPLAASAPYPIQVWRLGGDQLWIALGGEVVVDYSLDLKARYGPTTWVAGYTGDVMAYIPSKRVWAEGGYESGAFAVYGLPTTRWKEDVPERITAAIDRLVKKVGEP